MELDSYRLQAFSSLAQTGSFSKSAKLLGITQSALSQRIGKLEEELETSLFIRERSGLRLSSSAQELLKYCKQKEHLEEDFLSNLKRSGDTKAKIQGHIKVGAYSSVLRSLIIPAFEKLAKKNADIRFNFILPKFQSFQVF